jgi:hypothetical protein
VLFTVEGVCADVGLCCGGDDFGIESPSGVFTDGSVVGVDLDAAAVACSGGVGFIAGFVVDECQAFDIPAESLDFDFGDFWCGGHGGVVGLLVGWSLA